MNRLSVTSVLLCQVSAKAHPFTFVHCSAAPKNGSFTGTTTYGTSGAGLISSSSSSTLDIWPWLLHLSLSVTFSAVTHL
jgi:hypothetical protein